MLCFREGGREPGMVGGQALSWPNAKSSIAAAVHWLHERHAAGSICNNNEAKQLEAHDWFSWQTSTAPWATTPARQVTMTRRGSPESSG
jgi:hypothetical protein